MEQTFKYAVASNNAILIPKNIPISASCKMEDAKYSILNGLYIMHITWDASRKLPNSVQRKLLKFMRRCSNIILEASKCFEGTLLENTCSRAVAT